MVISTPVTILVAVLPALGMMIFIYLQDNHEKEPIGLLLKIFGLGILSAIPAIILEWIAEKILGVMFGGVGEIAYHAISAFFGVAVIEEGVKFLAAYFPTWRNKHFNYTFDGIVYCLFGSMGFAAIENVLYLLMEGSGTAQGVISLGVQRGLLAIPAHAMCGIFMGYYYGHAKYLKSYENRRGGRISLLTGFLIACSLHGFYDFCLFTQRALFFTLFVIFVVAADILTIIRIIKARKNNEKMYVAPQYRQYWAGPAADPYQAYGGYAAPTYGGYNYTQQTNNNNQFAPPVVGQRENYNPQIVGQNTNYQPNPITQQAGSSNYQPGTASPGSPYRPQGSGQYGQQNNMQFNQQPASQYNPQGNTQASQYNPQTNNQALQNTGAQQFVRYTSEEDKPQGNTTNYSNISYGTNEPRMITPPPIKEMQLHCPVCSAINNFHAFYCNECGASLHQL